MRIKKILSAILAAAITASSLSIVSSAKAPETTQTVEETVEKTYQASGDTDFDANFKYTELDDGTWAVTCPNEDTVKAVIPSTFKGKKVTRIGNSAFEGCTSLTSVTIPTSVKSIGNRAFYGCTSLKTLTIPSSVTIIGSEMFRDCTSLTSMSIPNSVTSLGDNAFRNCTKLASVTLSNKLTIIDKSTFEECAALKSVKIPNGVTELCDWAFYNCTSLTSVTIPNSVTSIDEAVFSGCTSLTSISIPNSVTEIGTKSFYGCTGLASITIPNSVTSLGGSIFSGCTSLKSVSLSKNLTHIPTYAFSGCTSLKSITIPDGVTEIGEYFWYSYTFDGCTNLTTVIIPKSVTTIGYGVFYSCPNLKDVYYTGPKAQWNSITIDVNNDSLESAKVKMHYEHNTKISGLKATPTSNSVKLTWSKNTSASYYKVFVWKNSKWTQLIKTANNTTLAYTASSLTPNTSYKYRVTAYNSDNIAISYSDITAKTKYGTIASLKAAPSNSSVKLTWGKYASASYYKVFIWKNSKWTQLTKTGSNATVAYTASSLAANTSYKFRVTAYNSSNKALAYSDITSKTYGKTANLKATPTNSTVKLTWSKYASASYYKVFIWKNSKWTQLTKTASNATVAYTASSLTANTSYKFRVTAYNSSDKAIAYSDITTTTKYGTIASLKAAPAKTSVKLTWGKNTSAGYYKVFIWKDSKWTQLTQTTSNATVAYTASKLTANTSYKFRVTAYNSSGKAIAYSDITAKTTA